MLAVNAFGDLFLTNVQGAVHWLDITAGRISRVANSEKEFRDAATELPKKNEWSLIDDAEKAERKGYSPGKGQCVGSKIPWIFKESANMPDMYVADLYEYVSFMGDVHCQINDVPDCGKVRIRVEPRPN